MFAHTLLPYIYTRSVTELKKQRRNHNNNDVDIRSKSWKEIAGDFVRRWLPPIQEFFIKNVRPVHLAIFYFVGAYYNFSKRLTGIRYVREREISLRRFLVCALTVV